MMSSVMLDEMILKMKNMWLKFFEKTMDKLENQLRGMEVCKFWIVLYLLLSVTKSSNMCCMREFIVAFSSRSMHGGRLVVNRRITRSKTFGSTWMMHSYNFVNDCKTIRFAKP
jgi:hypothetical protein